MLSPKVSSNIYNYFFNKSLFFGLIFFIIFFNFEVLFRPFIPCGDTLYKYENFYFFYNEYYFNNHIAQWTPFCGFGMPTSYYQLDSLNICSYLLFFLGKILKVTDVSILFKASVIIEHFFLLLGTYLLSKELFKSRLTIFIVCFVVLVTPYWDWQIDFQLQLRYLLPITLYSFLLFYTKHKNNYFWFGMILAVLSGVGNTPYIQFLTFFMLFIFNLFCISIYKNYSLYLKSILKFNKLSIIFLFLIFLIFYQFLIFRDFVVTPTRELGQKNSLLTFLTWWGSVPPTTFQDVFLNNIFGKSYLYYLGIIPMLFSVYSFFNTRSKEYLIFLFSFLTILWFSFGGVFASICYLFPFLSYYRHIGYAYSLYNIFLIFISGFGLDQFLSQPIDKKIRLVLLAPIVLIFISDGIGLKESLIENLKGYNSLVDFFTHIKFNYFYFRIGIYVSVLLFSVILFIFIQKRNSKFLSHEIFKFIILFCFIFEMNSYLFDKRIKAGLDQTFVREVNMVVYESKRHDSPSSTRQINIISTVGALHGFYEPVYNVAQFSPCLSINRQIVPRRIVEIDNFKPSISNDNLNAIIGCNVAKLRFVPKAKVNASSFLVGSLFQSIPNYYQEFILDDIFNKESSVNVDLLNASFIDESKIHVRNYTTDSIDIETDVQSPNGTWLVYADSYHPGWKATVNGVKEKTYIANLAFKAVHLNQGHNVVKWEYDHWPSRVASYLIAIISLGFCLFLCGWFFKVLLF